MKINVFLVFCDHIDIRFLQSSCISHLPNALSEHVVHHIFVSLKNITLSAIHRVAVLLVNLLILVVVALVGIRLDGEGEEVEASLVADEEGQRPVPTVTRIRHLPFNLKIKILKIRAIFFRAYSGSEMLLKFMISYSILEEDSRLANS